MRRTPLARRTPLRAKTGLRTLAPKHSRTSRSKQRVSSGIPAKVRQALKARSEGVCEIGAVGCDGRAVDPSHRKATGAGGRHGESAARHHVLSNLLHACRGCHEIHVHRYPAGAYWRGWALRQHEIPSEVPVLRRGMWVLLDDQGGVHPTKHVPEEAR